MSFEDAVLRTIRERGLVVSGDRVLVAVSGGPDSMALLHALAALAPQLRISLVVAHLDHGLRGEEGAADATFVRRVAADLGSPAIVESARVERIEGESVETAARRVRYAFLERAALETACARIATGHTGDDQAETVLMRLLRGAGPGGLSGIRVERPASAGANPALRVIRPLLLRTRAEVLAYLASRGVASRVDSTNALPDPLRNRVRQEILPRIAAVVNPDVARTLARFAEREGRVDRFLAAEAAPRFDALATETAAGLVAVDAAGLAAAEPALQPYLLRLAIERALANRALGAAPGGARPPRLEEAHLAACVALARGPAARRRLRLPGGITVRRVAGRLEFLADTRAVRPSPDAGFCFDLDVPGEVTLPGGGVRVVAARRASAPDRPPRVRGAADAFHVEFDWRAVNPPLTVRSRRAGDRIAPRGMRGSKSIQDLLVDRKVPWTERASVPIVADRERMLWVVGHAITREAAVTGETREALVLSLETLALPFGDR